MQNYRNGHTDTAFGKKTKAVTIALALLAGCLTMGAKLDAKLAILELAVLDPSTTALWKPMENIQIGNKQFADRSFTIKNMPVAYAGASYIHTAADSKKFTDQLLATFKVDRDADVYIAHDTRIVQKPEWLKSWEKTGDEIDNTEANPTSFALFKKTFTAGTLVELGNNGQSGGALMYMVIVAPKGYKGTADSAEAAKASDPSTRQAIWPACLGETDDWFLTPEAIRVGDNLIAYQRDTGAWYKNIDMAVAMKGELLAELNRDKGRIDDSTIDNNATTTQVQYLARLYTRTNQVRFRESALKGLSYLLAAQYPNGGWPQFYPLNTKFYSSHITYNDDAMVNVLRLLALTTKDPSFAFVDSAMKENIRLAIERGRDAIIKSQIVFNGKKTAWCAQHYSDTLLPAPARAYELASISGQESVGIVRYLMTIENPSPAVIESVQAAIAWFDSARIDGIVVKEIIDPKLPGGRDKVVVQAAGVPPIWARFYDLETGKPFFVGRDGIKRTTFAEVEMERRTGYNYYTNAPHTLIVKDYPAWRARWTVKENTVRSAY